MKLRAKQVLAGVLVFNVALVLVTLGLSYLAELRHPREGALIDVNGVRMHAIDTAASEVGDADRTVYDALVLIHGASTSALDFEPNLIPELSRRHRVVAIDRPGHGYSERGTRPEVDKPSQQAAIILDTLAQMGIERPVLIGHSWAGAVVLAALLDEHDAVAPAAGILIAGVTHPYDREDSTPTKLALAPYGGVVFRWQYLALIGRAAMPSTIERFFAPDAVPESYIEETGLDLSLRPDVYLFNSVDRSNLVQNIVEQAGDYPRIDAPVLSIAASEDHVVRPALHHDKLIMAVSGAEGVVIDGSGHLPHHTRTAEVVSAIEGFLERLE